MIFYVILIVLIALVLICIYRAWAIYLFAKLDEMVPPERKRCHNCAGRGVYGCGKYTVICRTCKGKGEL